MRERRKKEEQEKRKAGKNSDSQSNLDGDPAQDGPLEKTEKKSKFHLQYKVFNSE